MESNPTKSKRRKVRVKKIRTKAPGIFTQLLGRLFGSTYLENSRPINAAIIIVIIFMSVYFVLNAVIERTSDARQPTFSEKKL